MKFDEVAEEVGLKINEEKAKIMVQARRKTSIT